MDEYESRWVLKSANRNYFLCAAGEAPLEALCVFDSREAAERHLADLSEARVYMDTLERQGTGMPEWMKEGSLLPEPQEVLAPDLRDILEAAEIRYIALASEGSRNMELLSVDRFLEGARE